MIITIKGADFSTKNIGTLSTWTIFTSLGSGATYSGNRAVDKNSSLSATITIADGYELGSAGVSVIMGTTDVTSSAATVNGNTITISIATVTGNVTIKVPTLNTSTGEESGDDGSVVDITNQFEFQSSHMIGQCSSGGTFTSFNGSWVANENYVDISNYSEIKIKMSKTSSVSTNTGISFYDANKNVVAGYAHTLGDNQYGIMERTFKRVASPQTGQTIAQEVIEIPETAVYVRTTYWNTAAGTANYQTSFGEFYCIATPKTTS